MIGVGGQMEGGVMGSMNGPQEEAGERGHSAFRDEKVSRRQVGWNLALEFGSVGQSCRLGVICNLLGHLCPRGCLMRKGKRTMRKVEERTPSRGNAGQIRVLTNGPTCSFLNCHQHHQLTVFHLPKHPVPCILAVGNLPTLPLCECAESWPGGQTGAQFIAGEPGFAGSHCGSAPLPRQTASVRRPGSPVVVAPEEQGKFPAKQSRQERAI